MRVAIIDDEIQFAYKLKKKVENICDGLNFTVTVEIIKNPVDIVSKAVLLRYDIVLLDIEMPLLSGFDIANIISSMRGAGGYPYIIFIGSWQHLGFDVLKQFPCYFVMKDCLNDLEPCVARIHQGLEPEYTIKHGRELVVIKLKELLYMEKQGNYVDFVTVDSVYQERTSIDAKLKDIVSYGFAKVHSGAVVNIDHVVSLVNNCVHMSDNKLLPVSRAYRKSFREKLRQRKIYT